MTKIVIRDTDFDGTTIKFDPTTKKVSAIAAAGSGAPVITATTGDNGIATYPDGSTAEMEQIADSSGNLVWGFKNTGVIIINTPPVISLNGNASESLIVGDTYNEPVPTATDAEGDTVTITKTGDTVDTSKPGIYTVTWTADDGNGGTATAMQVVVVVANALPVITLLGNAAESVVNGGTYIEAGATATDAEDGDLTASIVTTGAVDTATDGVYTLTYTVTDNNGGTATATRKVTVTTDIAPTITLLGNAAEVVAIGGTYTDAGATASDAEDGDLTASITVNGLPLDPASAAAQTITYSVTDSNGSTVTATRTVTFLFDTTAPVIVLSASADTITVGDAFDPLTYLTSATDDVDGDVKAQVVISNPVDTAVAGNYVVTYIVTDSAGNISSMAGLNITVMPVPVPFSYTPDAAQFGIMGGILKAFIAPFILDTTNSYQLTQGERNQFNFTGKVRVEVPEVFVAGNDGSTSELRIAGNIVAAFAASTGNVATIPAQSVEVAITPNSVIEWTRSGAPGLFVTAAGANAAAYPTFTFTAV